MKGKNLEALNANMDILIAGLDSYYYFEIKAISLILQCVILEKLVKHGLTILFFSQDYPGPAFKVFA